MAGPTFVSFLPTPIDPSDVRASPSNTTRPSSILAPTNKHVDTSVSLMDAAGRLSASIAVDATITVGQISFENLDRNDWSFGFAQALRAEECIVEYAGIRSNTGSVIVTAFDARDNKPVFSDGHDDPKLVADLPWTKVRKERFTFFRSRGVIECSTIDAPGMRVPASIKNSVTSAENFVRRISDKREICCVLAVEDPKASKLPQILAHSIWTIDLSFTYRWLNGGARLLPTFTGQAVTLGPFQSGPPADPAYGRIFDPPFFTQGTYNERASEVLNRHIKAVKSDHKDEKDKRPPSVPNDFFS